MQSRNFEFLRPDNDILADLGGLAEAVLFIDPGSSLTRLRGFAEEVTKSIYAIEQLPRHPQDALNDLIRNPLFKNCTSPSLSHQINYLRHEGNNTAHGGKGKLRTAQIALGTAHQLASYMACKYYGKRPAQLPKFTDIPNPKTEFNQLKQTVNDFQQQLAQQQKQTQQAQAALEHERSKNSDHIEPPAKPDQAKRQQESQQVADSLQWNEAKTRALLIDTMLEQAHWDTTDKQQVSLEFELDYPDNVSGKGYADYVLWGDNGQPLAVIEAKKSGESHLQAGREQARLYADALENMGYQRPVIFYSNGYETFIWDDHQYNSYRTIYGFYQKDSLEYLIYQRHYRVAALEQNNPKLEIADRPYQIEAIKTVAAHFQQQRRKALIIQATGTGKTRVAIALTELLLRCGWAKRILFLCDRKELRLQANEAFLLHLPSEPRFVIGETNQIDQSARIYIATYPAMMNRFAQLDVGFFDLIIADESHRSIYNKYRDLFDYFDALQLGLTATPVKFISRNTFAMFDSETGDPTYEFGLDAAINNEPPYLANFCVKDLTTEFLREGIHYNDLTPEQQQQLEDDLGEDIAKQTTIAGKDIGRKIFSEQTDRIILENLINNGIKDETGSLIGKTIIFAQRQDHAEHLEKLFCKLYPQYGTKVCKVIHNKIPKVDSLIKAFKQKNDFRIAISVDMLDTGIDVPEIVNLVFAKKVMSWVKFWQMIGRGTRLCPNLFGQGKHKSDFRIFDHYGNFAYFDEDYKEVEDVGGKSLLQALFESRLTLAETALKTNHAAAFDTAIALIHADINDLPEDSIAVKRELRTVHQLQQTNALQTFDAHTQNQLSTTILPLMAARVLSDKFAIQFDKLIAKLQTCLVQQASCFDDEKGKLLSEIDTLAINIQAVRRKDAVIAEVRSPAFWQAIDIENLERIRLELRDIMKYRQASNTGGMYATPTTRTQDGEVRDEERQVKIAGANEALIYRRRLKETLDDMISNNPVLQKVRHGETIKASELQSLTSTILTTNPSVDLAVLNDFYGRTADQLHLTLRELIGMEPNAVEEHFKAFMHQHPELTAKQTRFMMLLKNYIAEHGSILVDTLYDAPFTSVDYNGIDGVFTQDDADDLFAVLKPFLRKQAESPQPQT